MRLEIQSIEIREVRPSSRTCAEDHTLYVSLKELEENVLKDSRIKSVDVHLVYPGERVRILNLMDVVQPRCKIDDGDANFPGFVGKLQLAGRGRTRSLAGIGVLVSNPETHRKYSAFLDMSGLAGEMSRYSNHTACQHRAEESGRGRGAGIRGRGEDRGVQDLGVSGAKGRWARRGRRRSLRARHSSPGMCFRPAQGCLLLPGVQPSARSSRHFGPVLLWLGPPEYDAYRCPSERSARWRTRGSPQLSGAWTRTPSRTTG